MCVCVCVVVVPSLCVCVCVLQHHCPSADDALLIKQPRMLLMVRAVRASPVVDHGSTLEFNYWCLGNTFFEESGCGLGPPGTAWA